MDTANQQLWLTRKKLENLDWAYNPLNYLQIYVSAFADYFYWVSVLTGRLRVLGQEHNPNMCFS